MRNGSDPIRDKAQEKRLQGINDFFADPKNIERIKENKRFSEEVSKFVEDRQENLIKELNMDLIKKGII